MSQCLLHKLFSKDDVKGELSHKGQERGRTVWPFKRHILAPSEIVGSIMADMWMKWLRNPCCSYCWHYFTAGNWGTEQLSCLPKVYGRCLAEPWNWPKSTESLLGASPPDFPLFAFQCAATPGARQDVCSWSGFRRISGIAKILDCAAVIFIYACMSRGLSEIAILLFIFITLTIDFFLNNLRQPTVHF